MQARVHWAGVFPVCHFWRVLSARVNRLSDGRELTVSAGRLAKRLCPLSQVFLRTSVSRLTYVKKNGLLGTDLYDYHESIRIEFTSNITTVLVQWN